MDYPPRPMVPLLVLVYLPRLKSSHFTCYLTWTCHVLMTPLRYLLDTSQLRVLTSPNPKELHNRDRATSLRSA